MSKQKLPKGWTHKKISEVIDHYENQTGADAVAEMEDAFSAGRGYRTMQIPIEVESQVIQLITSAELARKSGSKKPVGGVAEKRKKYGK